jgi:hypothetical protein
MFHQNNSKLKELELKLKALKDFDLKVSEILFKKRIPSSQTNS